MSQDLLDFFSLFFRKIVELHTSIVFPGTSFSIFTLVFLGAFGAVVISVLRHFFGLASGSAGLLKGGNNRNIRISKERKNDKK